MLDQQWIDAVKDELPELPRARRARLAREYGLAAGDVRVLTASAALANYFESAAQSHGDPKAAANWVMGEVLAALNAANESIAAFRIAPAGLARLLDLVRDGVVSHSAAKRVFALMVETGDPADRVAEREGLLQVRDADELARWVDDVLAEHPAEAERFRAGEKKLLGVLVGMVMKKSKGRADPRRVNQLLSERAGG
ncbi:MAG TPA: hypothetical protein VN607_01080 [Gemmatimonadaceae bacterium]|nr:hypothetical protein [Gemmatimonadaceae bacterium]